MKRRHRIGMGVLGMLAALTLPACAPAGWGYAIFERDAGSEDAIPDETVALLAESADPATGRFVGDHDGVSLWLVQRPRTR